MGAGVNHIDTYGDRKSLMERDIFHYDRDKYGNYENKYLKRKIVRMNFVGEKMSDVPINQYVK